MKTFFKNRFLQKIPFLGMHLRMFQIIRKLKQNGFKYKVKRGIRRIEVEIKL